MRACLRALRVRACVRACLCLHPILSLLELPDFSPGVFRGPLRDFRRARARALGKALGKALAGKQQILRESRQTEREGGREEKLQLLYFFFFSFFFFSYFFLPFFYGPLDPSVSAGAGAPANKRVPA